MEKFGIALMSFGIFCAALAFDMNVTVGSSYNIGLLNERQSILFVSGITFLAGIILFGFGFSKSEEVKNLNKFIFICSLPTLSFFTFKGYEVAHHQYIVEKIEKEQIKAYEDKKVSLSIVDENGTIIDEDNRIISRKNHNVKFREKSGDNIPIYIQWGDSSDSNNYTNNHSMDFTHIYENDGLYKVVVRSFSESGAVSSIFFYSVQVTNQ